MMGANRAGAAAAHPTSSGSCSPSADSGPGGRHGLALTVMAAGANIRGLTFEHFPGSGLVLSIAEASVHGPFAANNNGGDGISANQTALHTQRHIRVNVSRVNHTQKRNENGYAGNRCNYRVPLLLPAVVLLEKDKGLAGSSLAQLNQR